MSHIVDTSQFSYPTIGKVGRVEDGKSSDMQHPPLDYHAAKRAEFVQEVEYWQARALAAEEKSSELASQLYLYLGWIANPNLQGNIPRVLIGTHLAMAKSNQQKDGKDRVYRKDVACFSGCAEQTISSNWKTLTDNGLLDKENAHFVKDGNIENAAFLDIPRQVLVNPTGVGVVTKRQGGTRIPTCRHCGGANLQKELRFTCTDCGSVMSAKEIIMVFEETLQTEQEMIQQEQAEMQAVSIEVPITPEEIEDIPEKLDQEERMCDVDCPTCGFIAWVERHQGTIMLTNKGQYEHSFAVLWLPKEVRGEEYNRAMEQFKALRSEIETHIRVREAS